jgi:hypothetical protein
MSKNSILVLVLFLANHQLLSQCLSGNCINGSGKYDFGFATYQGSFKNGQPNGTGTMDYGGGEKYMGDFVNGKENGNGLMYRKNGSFEKVSYENGKLVKKELAIIVGSNTVVEGCLTGDCKEGVGTIILPSGNKYTGGFKNFQPHGSGTFSFVSGNTLQAEFKNGIAINGKLTYSTGEIFTGSFNADGTPKTGKYLMSSQGDAVEIKDNTIYNVRSIATEKMTQEANAKAEHAKHFKPCSKCGGSGGEVVQDSWKSSVKTYNGTIYDEYEVKTNYGPQRAQACLYCNGTGEVKR